MPILSLEDWGEPAAPKDKLGGNLSEKPHFPPPDTADAFGVNRPPNHGVKNPAQNSSENKD